MTSWTIRYIGLASFCCVQALGQSLSDFSTTMCTIMYLTLASTSRMESSKDKDSESHWKMHWLTRFKKQNVGQNFPPETVAEPLSLKQYNSSVLHQSWTECRYVYLCRNRNSRTTVKCGSVSAWAGPCVECLDLNYLDWEGLLRAAGCVTGFLVGRDWLKRLLQSLGDISASQAVAGSV